jgi:uncharacterized protein YkwD
MKKRAKAKKYQQGPISVTTNKRRPPAVFGVVIALVGSSIAAYATNDLLHGHVTKNERAQSAPASSFTDKEPATAVKGPAPSTTPSKLVDKYGSPATSQKVAAEIRRAEGADTAQQVNQRTLAERKAEAYVKLERGIIDPAR